jgi:hypothetical protein
MSRWVFVLLSVFFLSGCFLLVPEEKELSPALPEAPLAQPQEFEHYLDDFLAGRDPAALNQYLAGAPDSKQHEALRRVARALQQSGVDHAELTAELESKNKFIVDLEEKNHQLRETIEQLKSLLIQLEQRAH